MSRSRASSGPSQRQLRVGEQVRHGLAELLQRGDINDPDLDGPMVSVSEVQMSPDLRIATAYIAPLGGGDPKPVVKALARNAKFIRGRMTPVLKQMKFMPQFRFQPDESFENFAKIDRILRSPEVARDLAADCEEPDDGPTGGEAN